MKILISVLTLFTIGCAGHKKCGLIEDRYVTLPLTYVTEGLSKAQNEDVAAAAQAWNTSVGKVVIKYDKDSRNIISVGILGEKVLAVTQWWGSPSYAIVISKYANSYNGPFNPKMEAQFKYSLRSTMIHEFGHALGLDHFNHGNTIMYPSYRQTQEKGIYNVGTADVANLKCAYKNLR